MNKRVKRWVYAYDIDLMSGVDPPFEGNTADHLHDPVGIYLGMTFRNKPPKSFTINKNLYLAQVWTHLT